MRFGPSRWFALTALLAVVGLVAGRAAAVPVAVDAGGGKALWSAGDAGDQPFVRAAPTEAAKSALRDRRDGKPPLAKIIQVAALTLRPPLPPRVGQRTQQFVIGQAAPTALATCRCPRGPPAT